LNWAATYGKSHFTSQVRLFTDVFNFLALAVPKSEERSGNRQRKTKTNFEFPRSHEMEVNGQIEAELVAPSPKRIE
jgi:hypothetical protein